MNSKMRIIPVFVPHRGCKNDCVFCNQKRITGMGDVEVNAQYAENIVSDFLKTSGGRPYDEIAFFGGSFTAIDVGLQEELLSVGKKYKDSGIVSRIRMSTRPDAIDDSILRLQKRYGADIIELGIQSLDDEVLRLSNRGHTAEDSRRASALIQDYGFTLGHQIMPGLPGSTVDKDMDTCCKSIAMKPSIVRIYPTLVIKDTELLDMYEDGRYKPLTVEEAVSISADMYCRYTLSGIKVIRIGLQNTDTIKTGVDVAAGPFHPAFRQLVEEKLWLGAVMKALANIDLRGKDITIHANSKHISVIAGQNRSGIKKIREHFGIVRLSFEGCDEVNKVLITAGDRALVEIDRDDIFKYSTGDAGVSKYVS